jgi:toxin FitB
VILLDTVVVSEFRKSRPSPPALAWLRAQRADDLFLSVVTLGEIERGIALAPDDAFRSRLQRWLEETLGRFADHILDVTPAIARRWGRLSAEHRRADIDMLIAATADVHDMTIATRNTGHFAPLGISVVDPFL